MKMGMKSSMTGTIGSKTETVLHPNEPHLITRSRNKIATTETIPLVQWEIHTLCDAVDQQLAAVTMPVLLPDEKPRTSPRLEAYWAERNRIDMPRRTKSWAIPISSMVVQPGGTIEDTTAMDLAAAMATAAASMEVDAAMDEDTMTSLPMDRKTQMLDTSHQVAIPRGGKMVLAATMDTEPRIH